MTFKEIILKYKTIEHIARKLIIHHTKIATSDIYKNIDQEIDFDIKIFEKNIKKYIDGMPLQYIIGYTYFLDLKLFVKKGIYIPRPETEALVEEILLEIDEIYNDKKITIADVCSGSGAISLALNKYTKQKTFGLELSNTALEQAKENNKYNNCNVKFVKSNVDQYLIENNIQVDVLVANPPYIKPNTILESRVQDYEPKMALFDQQSDGLSFYRQILKNLYKTTKSKAIIAFEFGYDQKDDMEKLIEKYLPNCQYKIIYDYANNPRGVIINKSE